jgi:hypothetical protein
MNTDHLTRFGDNPLFAHCTRPCNGANDYKPINCATYPLYPVNIDLTEWVRGAPARCPISDARLRRQIPIIADGLRRMERNHPGSIKTLVDFIRTYPGALGPLDKDKNGK